MKRDLTQENFEEFLKRSADSLRMKASEKVWQNLSKELNKRRRRFILGVGAFLLISSGVGYFVTNNVSQQADISLQKPPQQQTSISKTTWKNEDGLNKTYQPTTLPTVSTVQLNKNAQGNTDRNSNKITKSTFINSIQSTQPNNQLSESPDETLAAPDNFTSTVVDSYTEFNQPEAGNRKEIKQADLTTGLPLTIESVINAYKAKNKKSKLEKQFYFSPTISYRKLTENKSYLRTLNPANMPSNFPALHSSVSNNVTHKPDVGFELGFTTKYALSDKLKLRSGIQFNVNRYDVKAFSSPLSIATIALNNGPRVDSLNTISGYSNVQGYKSNWLQNFSIQLSVPIGIEYNFKRTNKLQFGLASTIQPTYVLGDRAYLITADYKSYTQVPWLIRRWNVNTAFEAFVKYKGWQFGPQVRYQLLSSFDSKYSVKENLFDFGLKIGVTLNK